MHKPVTLAFSIVFAALVVGCTPSPEKVCNHAADLEEERDKEKKKDQDEIDPKLEKLIKKAREKFKTQCPKALAVVKDDSPDAYKCFAKCVMAAKDYDKARKCDDDCDGFKTAWKKAAKKTADDADDEPKKKSSDEDEDEVPKKKKKSSDEE